MRTNARHLLAGLAAVVVLGLGHVAFAQEGLMVVVNDSNEISSISAEEVKAIFLGNQNYWPGQKTITAIARPEAVDAGKSLFKDILHMTPARFRHHWSGLELSGKGVTPSMVARIEDVGTLVQGNTGAISVVAASEAAVLKKYKVKTLPLR